MKLALFYAFARSGGTLLNRCLGCMPKNLVLSEVNPHGAVISLEEQAKDWLHLLNEAELSLFFTKSYHEKIFTLLETAHKKDCHLIIRDWTSLNYLDEVIPGEIFVPSFVPEQEVYLQHYRFEHTAIVLTRRAADVYESLLRTFEHLHVLSVEDFGRLYRAYAEAVSKHPIFHYEQLCFEPINSVKEICQILEINYDPSFITSFSSFNNCTGDNTLSKPSRGTKLEKITSLNSNQNSPLYIEASLNQDCRKADELFNYTR